MTQDPTEIQIATEIAARPEAVWNALTDRIGEWWPAEFYIGGEEGERSYHLEARPGGRVYEQWQDGGGLLWGQVCTVVPHRLLQVNGYTFPEWGGPSITFAEWKLAAAGEGCSLHFSERALGATPDDYHAEKQKGWSFLLQTMKAYLEGTTPPAWEG